MIVVDRALLINTHRIFVLIRANIDHLANSELLGLVMKGFKSGGLNSTFIDDVNNSQPTLKDYVSEMLTTDTGTFICTDNNFETLFAHVLLRLMHLLDEGNSTMAYDIIDAFHVLPELAADGIKIDYADFFRIYVEPLGVKWGTSLLEEFSALVE